LISQGLDLQKRIKPFFCAPYKRKMTKSLIVFARLKAKAIQKINSKIKQKLLKKPLPRCLKSRKILATWQKSFLNKAT
jgi:hypothetical protein